MYNFEPSDITSIGWCDSYSIPSNNPPVVTWNTTHGTALFWAHNMTRVIPEIRESQYAPASTNRFIGFFKEQDAEFQLLFWDIVENEIVLPKDGSLFRAPYEIITYNEEFYLGIQIDEVGDHQLSFIHFRDDKTPIPLFKLLKNQTIESLKPSVSVKGKILFKRQHSNGSIICDYITFDPNRQIEVKIFEGTSTKIPVSARWSPDGDKVVFLLRTSRGLSAEIVDINTREIHSVVDLSLRELPIWHPDGQRLVLTLDNWPTSSFVFYHIGLGKVQILPMNLDAMTVAPVWVDKNLYFLGISPDSPASLFTWKEGDESPKKITPTQKKMNLGMPTVLDIESKNGYTIPCLLYTPQKTAKKTILMLHGGPSGSWWANWSPVVLSFVASNFNVMLVNPRGSTIRNRNLPTIQPNRFGVDDLEDVKDCIDYLIESGLAINGEIGLYGHSYGGFLSFVAMQSFSEVIGAVVITSGYLHPAALLYSKDESVQRFANYAFPSNLLTQLPESIQAFKPILQVHGENDLQLRIDDAEKIHYLLEKQDGINHRFIRLSEESHAYRKKNNIVYWISEACFFFRQYL